MPLTRRALLGAAGVTGLGAAVVSCHEGGGTRPSSPFEPLAPAALDDEDIDQEFLATLAELNDEIVLEKDSAIDDFLGTRPDARNTMRELKKVTAAYLSTDSQHFHQEALAAHAERLVERVQSLQTESKLFNSGGNRESPPDSCFSLVDMTIVKRMIDLYDGDLNAVSEILDDLAPSVARAVVESHGGGVHTANHRWEVAGALFEVNALWPDSSLVDRGREWLAEGIDAYDDGHYSERSTIYDSEVVNPSLLRIAAGTEDGSLLDLVRANLKLALTLTSPGGTVESVHSRRQDQNDIREDWWYLLQYREFALRDDEGTFSFQAERIVDRGVPDMGVFLGDVLSRPELARELPPAEEPTLNSREDYLDSSGLLILRDGITAATFFAGSDYPDHGVIASGLSTNPTFFKYRNGAAELASMRVSPEFFSMGPLRPESLTEDGETVRMAAEHMTGYHKPLVRSDQRRADGMYTLEDDGRFWSAMSFSERERADLSFSCDITISPSSSGYEVNLTTDSLETLVVMQLSFAGEGELTFDAQTAQPEESNAEGARPYLLTGTGGFTWEVGKDSLRIDIDEVADAPEDTGFDSGEKYTYLNGFLPAPSLDQVLIPFSAPGTFTLTITPG